MTYRLAVSDIDGTLVNREKKIPRENREAIEAFRSRGGLFSLATGRIERSALPYCRELGIDLPVILYNGARIVDPLTGEVVREHLLAPEDVREALDVLEEFPFDPIFYSRGEAYVGKVTPAVERYQRGDGFACRLVDSLRDLADEPVTKILMIGEGRLFPAFREKFHGAAHLVQSEGHYLEILPAGVSKGAALEELTAYLGLTPADAVCFGDNLNDLEMIDCAGLGVAMENGHDLLKEKAGLIAPSHETGGVGTVLNRLVTGEKE